MLKRMPIRQWFDNYSLDDPAQRPDLQVDGLCETAEFLRSLVQSEAELLLGHDHDHDDGDDDDGDGDVFRRIIVGGLSQGCAASVFALLGGGFGFGGNLKDANGPGPLGAFVGMSGWLPFHAQLRDIARSTSSLGSENGDDFDPFSTSADDGQDEASEHGPESPLVTAINHVRDILDLPPLRSPDILSEEKPAVDHLRIPVFLGHGSADPKVSVQLGEKMADFLSAGLSMDVTWKAYEGFGHWYKVPDEIDDIVCFLKEKVGVPGCV